MNQENLLASSAMAWVILSKLVNENQQPIEFTDHRFMIDFYCDDAADIVSRKSAQVGFSVAAILKSFHECKYKDQNVIYALPTNNVVQDFVKPKMNPLITYNPIIQAMVKDDSVAYKRIGDRNLFIKGGFSDREAISITGDVLVIDEFDRMPDMRVVNTFDSRLQASKNPKRWRFSNPSQVGFGVDALYQDSDQRHWFVKCPHCNYEWFMDWDNSEQAHYVDREKQIYACGKCHKVISDDARRNGQWLARFPRNPRHGYWFNQMMAPWVSARRIIEQYEESGIEFFHNFVLGKAYTPTDMIVDRAAILRATAPSNIDRRQVAMGVDQDAGGQYYCLMTPQGVFEEGYVDSWEKIEHIKLMYKAVVVADPRPYDAMPKQLANKYGDFYMCYFKILDTLSPIEWKEKERIVYADRTRVLDIRANEIVNARMLYRQRPHELEEIIKHWNNIYRTTEEKEDGKIRSIWVKKEGKQSDYPFAEVYARIALTQLLGGQSDFIEPISDPETKMTNLTATEGGINVDFSGIIEDTYSEMNQ